MGKYDSSKTRVAPVFNALIDQDGTGLKWIPQILNLPAFGHPQARVVPPAGSLLENAWDPEEKPLAPPISLLVWLIRNLSSSGANRPGNQTDTEKKRRLLFDRDPGTVLEALDRLRGNRAPKEWHVLEGMTQPDVYLATGDAIIVIEGKRTEAGSTTHTTWMPGRLQMLRHIDAAWEIRGHRNVYGFFIVEGETGPNAVDVPAKWIHASLATFSAAAIANSLPHRGPAEQSDIARCFLGVTTWQTVCKGFGIPWASLP